MNNSALLALALLLTGCTAAEQQQAADTVLEQQVAEHGPEEGENEPGSMEQEIAEHAPADGGGMGEEPDAGAYVAYSASALTDGTEKVLFFHAPWCPVCKVADAELTEWYGTREIPLSVHKVNYDTETELRSRYGVAYQHTFVKVDGQGNLIEKIQGPSDAELQAMIGL